MISLCVKHCTDNKVVYLKVPTVQVFPEPACCPLKQIGKDRTTTRAATCTTAFAVQVYVVTDCSGTFSKDVRDAALMRMVAAGMSLQALTRIQHNFAVGVPCQLPMLYDSIYLNLAHAHVAAMLACKHEQHRWLRLPSHQLSPAVLLLAGAIPINFFALACELQRDWRDGGEKLLQVCTWVQPNLTGTTQHDHAYASQSDHAHARGCQVGDRWTIDKLQLHSVS